jgi:predicted nuclease of predicted toxin-antitoxin system
MKLIVDAQLPVKLCEILKKMELDSIHVDELPKGDETPDNEIIKFADTENLFVVSKGYDFYHSHMALGKPKKLFLIATGNLKNRQLFDLFRTNTLLIKNALDKSSFVELSNEGLIQHS